MGERPSQDILSSAFNGVIPSDSGTLGSVMFQRSGRIGLPLQGGNQLILPFDSLSGPAPEPILLSRATGRPSSK